MPTPAVLQVLAAIQQLSDTEQGQLYSALTPWLATKQPPVTANPMISDLRESRFAKGVVCPRCGSASTQGWGKTKQGRRYRCNECRRTFNDFTATPLEGTRRQDKWQAVAECMLEGMSIRKTAAKVGLSPSTVFRWRHSVLDAMRSAEEPHLAGIVEADEIYFRESRKGERKLPRPAHERGKPASMRGLSREQVSVVVARDRQRNTLAKVSGRSQPKAKQLAKILGPAIETNAVVCSDGASAYKTFSQQAGLMHHAVPRKLPTKGAVYHIQNVNAYHKRLRAWMARFNGVATKYLENYTTWFEFVDKASAVSPPVAERQMLTKACFKG